MKIQDIDTDFKVERVDSILYEPETVISYKSKENRLFATKLEETIKTQHGEINTESLTDREIVLLCLIAHESFLSSRKALDAQIQSVIDKQNTLLVRNFSEWIK